MLSTRDKTGKRAIKQARIRPTCCCKLYVHVHTINECAEIENALPFTPKSLLVAELIYWRRVSFTIDMESMGDPKRNRLPHLCVLSRFWVCASEKIRDFCWRADSGFELAEQILDLCWGADSRFLLAGKFRIYTSEQIMGLLSQISLCGLVSKDKTSNTFKKY